MYVVSKVFRGAETYYENIKKLTLIVIVVKRKLRPYFHGHKIFVKTNYHVQQVLKNPYLAGMMVSWAVEISEYDI